MAGKADLGKRVIAFVIDAIPVILVAFMFGLILNPADSLIIGGPAVGLMSGLWWLFRDGLNLALADKRSPGKKIMKLRPVRLDGQVMTLETSIKRNLPVAFYCVGYLLWIVPMARYCQGLGPLDLTSSLPLFVSGMLVWLVEAAFAITDSEGRRWGDRLAGTKVIEAAD